MARWRTMAYECRYNNIGEKVNNQTRLVYSGVKAQFIEVHVNLTMM